MACFERALPKACGPLLALTLSSLAYATPPREVSEEARRLFFEGRALMASKSYAKACEKFRDSLRLDLGGGTLLNLALCNELRGKTATAYNQYAEALGLAQKDGRADRVEFAEQHRAALLGRLSYLRIDVADSARVPGLVIRKNGIEVGRAVWNEREPADPGTYVVEASAPGRVAMRTQVEIRSDGETQTVSVTPLAAVAERPHSEPRASASAPPPLPTDHGPSTQRILGGVVGGVGIIAMGVGAGFGIHAIGLKNDNNAACPGYDASAGTSGQGCDPAAFNRSHDAVRAADISTAFIAAGAVVSGVGAYLFFSAPTERAPRAGVGVGPGSVQLVGRF